MLADARARTAVWLVAGALPAGGVLGRGFGGLAFPVAADRVVGACEARAVGADERGDAALLLGGLAVGGGPGLCEGADLPRLHVLPDVALLGQREAAVVQLL